MDRKTIIAVALCLLFLVLYKPLLDRVGLGGYLSPPRPTAVDSTRTSLASDTTRAPGLSAGAATPGTATAPAVAGSAALANAFRQPSELERTYQIETPFYRATFTNRGARLLSVELKRYASAHGVSGGRTLRKLKRGEMVPAGDRVVLAGGPLIAMDLGSREKTHSLVNMVFAVQESLDASGNVRTLAFSGRDSTGLVVRQVWRVRADDYALDLEVQMSSIPAEWRLSDYTFTMRSWPLITEADMEADVRGLRATSLVGTNIHRESVGALLKAPKPFEGNALWAAVQNRYFINSLVAPEGSLAG